MEYRRTLPTLTKPSAVALGLFDGLHLGHRAVISRAVSCGPELLPVVFTFSFDSPEEATKPDFANILSSSRKEGILQELGVQLVCEPAFSSFRDMAPEEFFEEVLCRKLQAAALFCGEDFRFGKNAAGDTTLLKKLCRKAGIHLETVPAVQDQGEPVSSTRIRRLLRQGDMEAAARLLGEPYTIDYPVSHGRQLGRTMGYPTINQLYPAGDLLPRNGVYATLAVVEGKCYPAVTNVGVKPTLGGLDAPSAESTLLGFEGDLYGKQVPVSFYRFLRPEQKFPDIETLFRQVAEDARQAKNFFEKNEKNA